jgi:hypothetical protein
MRRPANEANAHALALLRDVPHVGVEVLLHSAETQHSAPVKKLIEL